MGLLVSCGTENEPTYTLTTTVTPEGFGTIEPASGEYTEGEVVTITASSNEEGFKFKQWGGDWNDNSNPTTITMTRDYSVIGVFERQVYDLEVLVEGQGSVTETVVSQPSGDYPYETVVEVQSVPSNGWRFVEWTGDVTGTENPESIVMDGAKRVTAVFERQMYDLEVLVEGQGSVIETIVSQPSGDYLYETVVELQAVPSNGRRFVEWTGDVTGTENPASIAMDGAKSVTAVFVELWTRDTETVVVEVVNPTTGVTWMDRNLGASRAATSSTDTLAYGDLYQWGRAADGHEKRNSSTRSTLSSSDQPGHEDFITVSSEPYDWRSPGNDNLWQGVNGVNIPCPVGYRLPTIAEWSAEIQSWSSNNSAGAYGSPLKLPVAGYRYDFDGSLYYVGSFGSYWSSSVDGTYARRLNFGSGDIPMYSSLRAFGRSVRCRKD